MGFITDKQIHTVTFIAMGASLIGAVADVLLLYNPEGGYHLGDYKFLLNISDVRLMTGAYLGILFIPLEVLGLFHIYKCIKPAGKKLVYPIIFLGVYATFPGVVYHGTVAFTATYLKMAQQLPADLEPAVMMRFAYLKSLSEPLGVMLFFAFLVVSLLFAYAVAFKKTHYKGWMALCNPFAFYIVFVLLYLTVKPVGNILIPAGFNLAFFLFFLCSFLARKPGTYEGVLSD